MSEDHPIQKRILQTRGTARTLRDFLNLEGKPKKKILALSAFQNVAAAAGKRSLREKPSMTLSQQRVHRKDDEIIEKNFALSGE